MTIISSTKHSYHDPAMNTLEFWKDKRAEIWMRQGKHPTRNNLRKTHDPGRELEKHMAVFFVAQKFKETGAFISFDCS